MRLHWPGKTPFLIPLFLLLSSCRDSTPPVLSIICIGDGVGGADCVDSTGAQVHKDPSDLLNFWMTTEADEQNFTSWCYDESESKIQNAMRGVKEHIR
jgi:hypothetical protein